MGKRVYVVGVGMTKFEKPGRRANFDYPEMVRESVGKALADCALGMKDVQAACVGYVYGDSTCGQRAIYEIGMTGIPIFNVNNNCATGSSALLLAKMHIEAGNDCVLAVGFEKMERGSLKPKFSDRTYPMDKHVLKMIERDGFDPSVSVAAQIFGNAGREHMKLYGTKPEHFGKIAEKNHRHSANNPNSQFQDVYSLEDIMKSTKIYDPLTKLQCCPTSDGSAAVILASESFVLRHGLTDKAIEIVGMEMATDLPSTFGDSAMRLAGYDMTRCASERLYSKTGIRPEDVEVVELHDCFSANELITYEGLGLCPPGGAAEFIDKCQNTYGGRCVVNPSGGLISKGHPLGATGLAQCTELCLQLRGEAGKRQVPGAKIALQHNLGLGGAVVVALYRKGFERAQIHPNNVSANKKAKPEDFRIKNIFDILANAMKMEDLSDKIGGVFAFKVRRGNKTGYWVVDFKNGSITFKGKTKPDVMCLGYDRDLINVLSGKLSPRKAYYEGKLIIYGSMELAAKLRLIQRLIKSHLEIKSKL